MTVPVMTRDQAAAAVKAAVAERDAIQANLLELDSSFGKQLLAGAELTGATRRRWDATSATLGTLWQVFEAYSAVVDQAAEAATRHLGPRELAAISELLAGRSVQLASGPAPLAGRDLADPGHEDLTMATAVARMRGAFSAVTEVVTAAEHVWTEVAGRLDAARRRAGPGDAAGHDARRRGADRQPDRRPGQAGPAARHAELRPAGAVAAGRHGRHLGSGPPRRAGHRGGEPGRRTGPAAGRSPPARHRGHDGGGRGPFGPRGRRRGLAAGGGEDRRRGAAAPRPRTWRTCPAGWPTSARCWPAAGGRAWRPSWTCSSASWPPRRPAFREAERAVVAAMAKRDELRGLLGAYKAKAARLGGAEDPGLAAALRPGPRPALDRALRPGRGRGRGGRLPAGCPGGAAVTTCAQPGCGGTIQDGYCDTCGLAASAAPRAPSASSGSAQPSLRGRPPAVPGPGAGAGGAAGRPGAGWARGWWRSRRCRTATRPAPSWPTRRCRRTSGTAAAATSRSAAAGTGSPG